jgi:hypothetical protein
LFKNNLSGNGTVIMVDGPGTAKFLYGKLSANELKGATLKVTASYTVLIYHKQTLIGYAGYGVTFGPDLDCSIRDVEFGSAKPGGPRIWTTDSKRSAIGRQH